MPEEGGGAGGSWSGVVGLKYNLITIVDDRFQLEISDSTMREEKIFYAYDSSMFTNEQRCILYEEIADNLLKLHNQEFAPEVSIHVSQLHKSIFSVPAGDKRLDYMLSMIQVARSMSKGIADFADLINAICLCEGSRSGPDPQDIEDVEDWKCSFGGIAKEIVDIPPDASPEDVIKVLRQHDSNRLATVLSGLEDTQLPIRIYYIISAYLC